MDIKEIAAAVVTFLSPYLIKAGEAFAEDAGQKLIGKASELYTTLKKRFKRDSYAKQTLTRFEEKPHSEERQAALKGVLVETMKEDADFAELVRRLVEESRQLPGSDIINQQLTVSGKAEDVFQIGKIEGDSSITS